MTTCNARHTVRWKEGLGYPAPKNPARKKVTTKISLVTIVAFDGARPHFGQRLGVVWPDSRRHSLGSGLVVS